MFELIREMLKLVPEMRRRLYLSAALKVIESLFISAPYGFLVLTLNDILSHTLSRDKVFFYTAGMAACFLLQGLFFYLYARTAYPLATKLGERIRIIVGEHLRKLSMSYFSNKTTGDLNALVSDELVIVGIIPRLAFPVFITGITLPMAFIPFLLFIDWRLALTTLVVVPLSMPFFKKNQKILRNGFDLRSKSLITISSKIIEYVQGMAEVKAFKQTGRQFTKFDDVLRKFKKDNLDLVIQSITPNMLYKTVLDFGFAMILMVGAYMFLGGKITLFTFLVFLIVGLRVYEPIKAMSTVFELVRIAEVTIGRVRTLLDTPLLPQPTNAVTPRAYDIEFRKVTFSYDEKPVLENISFTIPAKTITAFVGASGAGKTTITRLIARFWDIDAGEIRIGGHDIRKMNTDTLLSMLSMVFQDVYLFKDTIYTNIAYGARNATKEQVMAAARAARCHDFIVDLPKGYDTMVGEGGVTLSGGEKQRISIARAILKDAPIILLDEATASVDPENEHLIQDAINKMVESKTLVVIAHRLSTIASADQIVVLDGKGGIEVIGTHAELLDTDGVYRKFWESRQRCKSWKIDSANLRN